MTHPARARSCSRTRRIAALSAALLSLAASLRGRDARSDEYALPATFLPITDAQKALTAVPHAPGAPAAILFEGLQVDGQGPTSALTTYHRRLKILTGGGTDRYGDFSYEAWGDARVKTVLARTVLPDGTVVDARDGVHQDESGRHGGLHVVRIAFPRVQVGAILDLVIVTSRDSYFIPPWYVQEDVPVLASRFLFAPIPGVEFHPVVAHVPPEKAQPIVLPWRGRPSPAGDVAARGERPGAGRAADPDDGGWRAGSLYAWQFNDVPPLPDVPFRPPMADVAQQLVMIVTGYHDGETFEPWADSWTSFSALRARAWDEWSRRAHGAAAALAMRVTAGKTSARDKAEAIRMALRDRVHAPYGSAEHGSDSPDEVLREGAGGTADVAGLTVAMLTAANVPARVALFRRRDSGSLPADVPIPALLDDALVVIRDGDEDLFFAPAADLPVGTLPWQCRGVLAVPLQRDLVKPVPLPDPTADDDRTVRTTDVQLDAQGNVKAVAVMRYHGVAGEDWRERLRHETEANRRLAVEDDVRLWMAGAHVTSLDVRNLDDPTKELVVHCAWEAAGYATPAGKRMLLDPNVLERVTAADWSAERRDLPIDMGWAWDHDDDVTIHLPGGVVDVTLPQSRKLSAPPVGSYEIAYDRKETEVRVRRHVRMELFRFPAEAYPGLKKWFVDMSAQDDQVIVLTTSS